MRCFSILPCILMTLSSLAVIPVLHAEDVAWQPVKTRILSKFAGDVDPRAPLPEYPRPQLVRDEWKNLNGLWDYMIVPVGAEDPFASQGKILVPFPVESALSGVGKRVGKENNLLYRTMFDVPVEWKIGKAESQKRLVLHFGAVDWKCVVEVNGKQVGEHVGGYSPFSFDITDALKNEGPQELRVTVWDPTDDNWQPRGKQVNAPKSIWYTSVTGIWRTVWLEPVAPTRILGIKPVTNVAEKTTDITVTVEGARENDKIAVLVKENGNVVASALGGKPGTPQKLKFADPKFWTPDTPFLYEMEIFVNRDNQPVDRAKSYLGLREIKVAKDENGINRLMLNGKFVFQHGPLDQGWWPDGLYTAPTDEALLYDLKVTKDLGYNMLRKHVKTEPDRFYYHCDRLGLLVWQDMPNGDKHIGAKDPDIVRTPESAANFERELEEMIRTLEFFQCIVMWVPFNEGWGQYDTPRIVQLCRKLDPTRPINNASGWTDRAVGDVYDIHDYPGPKMPQLFEDRVSVLGEYGGLALPIKDHLWQDDKNWGYQQFDSRETLFNRYRQLNAAMAPMIAKGLSAAVYTQTTDVEIEVNGLMTYDREVIKFDVNRMALQNNMLHFTPPTYVDVVPTAQSTPVDWRYTNEKPVDGWEKPEFDDTSWALGKSGFGKEGTPCAVIGTPWTGNDIWLRRTVEIGAADLANPALISLLMHHDDDVEVYVNGIAVLRLNRYTTDYQIFPLESELVAKAFRAGKNVIAVHCKQVRGNQYIDLGIQKMVPPKEPVRLW